MEQKWYLKGTRITQMVKLLDRMFKKAIMSVFRLFKKLEERLNMLSRDIDDNKELNWTHINKN